MRRRRQTSPRKPPLAEGSAAPELRSDFYPLPPWPAQAANPRLPDGLFVCRNDAKMPSFFRGAAMKYALCVLLCGLAGVSGATPLLAQSDLDQRVGKEMDSLVA